MRWLVLCLFLSGCGLSSLGLLTGGGGGPTVNSNAQIGKENTNIPPWVIILLILGWLLPTPTEMGRGILNFVLILFKREKM